MALSATTAGACDALQPFDLKFRVLRGDIVLGKGHNRLIADEQPGCFIYQQTAKPKF